MKHVEVCPHFRSSHALYREQANTLRNSGWEDEVRVTSPAVSPVWDLVVVGECRSRSRIRSWGIEPRCQVDSKCTMRAVLSWYGNCLHRLCLRLFKSMRRRILCINRSYTSSWEFGRIIKFGGGRRGRFHLCDGNDNFGRLVPFLRHGYMVFARGREGMLGSCVQFFPSYNTQLYVA